MSQENIENNQPFQEQKSCKVDNIQKYVFKPTPQIKDHVTFFSKANYDNRKLNSFNEIKSWETNRKQVQKEYFTFCNQICESFSQQLNRIELQTKNYNQHTEFMTKSLKQHNQKKVQDLTKIFENSQSTNYSELNAAFHNIQSIMEFKEKTSASVQDKIALLHNETQTSLTHQKQMNLQLKNGFQNLKKKYDCLESELQKCLINYHKHFEEKEKASDFGLIEQSYLNKSFQIHQELDIFGCLLDKVYSQLVVHELHLSSLFQKIVDFHNSELIRLIKFEKCEISIVQSSNIQVEGNGLILQDPVGYLEKSVENLNLDKPIQESLLKKLNNFQLDIFDIRPWILLQFKLQKMVVQKNETVETDEHHILIFTIDKSILIGKVESNSLEIIQNFKLDKTDYIIENKILSIIGSVKKLGLFDQKVTLKYQSSLEVMENIRNAFTNLSYK